MKLLLLPDVGAERYDLGIICLLDPFQDDRRIKSSRISDDDFHAGCTNTRGAVLRPGRSRTTKTAYQFKMVSRARTGCRPLLHLSSQIVTHVASANSSICCASA